VREGRWGWRSGEVWSGEGQGEKLGVMWRGGVE
jgi:hypothetical protein